MAPASLLAAGLVAHVGPAGLILATEGEARAASVAGAAQGLAPHLRVGLLPGWDCLPFDRAGPSRAIMGTRMATVRRLVGPGPHLLIAPVETLAQRLPAPHGTDVLQFVPGDAVEPDALAGRLERPGYALEDQADAPGEAALRSMVVDIFSADAAQPARLRLDDGRIAAIELYDPLSQRSTRPLGTLTVGPASVVVFAGPQERPPNLGDALPSLMPRLVSVFDLLPDAPLLLDPGAPDQLSDGFGQIESLRPAQPTKD